MPIFHWGEIHKGRYEYVLRNPVKPSKYMRPFFLQSWEKVHESYVEKFGFSQDFLEQHRKRMEIALLQAERAATGDRRVNTRIAVAKEQLKAITPEVTKLNLEESIASLSKAVGHAIDPMRTSVAMFFSYMQLNTSTRG